MKKAIWISFLTALVVVNLIAWLTEYYSGLYIAIPFRLALVLGITFVTMVFAGAYFLVQEAEKDVSTNKGAEREKSSAETASERSHDQQS